MAAKFVETSLTVSGEALGLADLSASTAHEKRHFGCSLIVRSLKKGGALNKLQARTPFGFASVAGASVRIKSRAEIVDAIKAATAAAKASNGDVVVTVVYPPPDYNEEDGDDEEEDEDDEEEEDEGEDEGGEKQRHLGRLRKIESAKCTTCQKGRAVTSAGRMQ